mmetsp:Transcript_5039/g.12755  ORF Transcript_5039/g.12755 Transcript_5039/m.12755 type:complete len:297 (+) Transcript_5039:159-1049(+)
MNRHGNLYARGRDPPTLKNVQKSSLVVLKRSQLVRIGIALWVVVFVMIALKGVSLRKDIYSSMFSPDYLSRTQEWQVNRDVSHKPSYTRRMRMTEFSHLSAGHHPKVFPTESYKPHSQSLFNKTSANPIDKLDKASYKPITSFHKDDIEEELLDPNATHEMSYENAINGREHLVAILSDAGVSMDVEVIASLPKWNDVTQMYGGNDGPVIIGLERCEEYRRKTPVHDAYIGTAGMFNTGTNPFAMYLEKNCEMPHNTKDRTRGMHWWVVLYECLNLPCIAIFTSLTPVFLPALHLK